MDKKVYIRPSLKVVEFQIETGYAASSLGLSHEGFNGEMSGHESFVDNTGDFTDDDYRNF